MARFTGILGLLAILCVCFAFSRNRRAIQPRILLWGLGLQISLAVLILKTPFGGLFDTARVAVSAMLGTAGNCCRSLRPICPQGFR